VTFKSKIRAWKTLSLEHDGRLIVGSYAYTEIDQTVEVRSLTGKRKSAPLGDSSPETLARLMLAELADQGQAGNGNVLLSPSKGIGASHPQDIPPVENQVWGKP
jgi:hypothetical protein